MTLQEPIENQITTITFTTTSAVLITLTDESSTINIDKSILVSRFWNRSGLFKYRTLGYNGRRRHHPTHSRLKAKDLKLLDATIYST